MLVKKDVVLENGSITNAEALGMAQKGLEVGLEESGV